MIKLYSAKGAFIDGFEVANREIERELSLPPVMKFDIHRDLGGPFELDGSVKSDLGDYIIKEKNKSGEFYSFVCKPDFSALQADLISRAYITVTAAAAMTDALNGTGWTHETTGTIKRSVTVTEDTRYNTIFKIADAFGYELYFDIANKKIKMAQTIGAALGRIYVHDDVNLIDLSLSGDSYDVYTRIIPRGANGTGIESVNGGVPYLENFQYTNRVKPFIWEDGRYTDLESLKADAAAILDDISKPRQSYEIKVLNLYKQNPAEWGFLMYDVGDYIDLVSGEDGIKTAQRIVKTSTFTDENGENDTITISNVMRDYAREQETTVRQATETIRAELKLLDDGIEARVQTQVQHVISESDLVTNSELAGEITAQLQPLQQAVNDNEDAIGDVEAAILGKDERALKNLMETLSVSYSALTAQAEEFAENETVGPFLTANNTKYNLMVGVYNSAIADGKITEQEWADFDAAVTAYKISSADLERELVSVLNTGIGNLQSELTVVQQNISGDSIIQRVTTTQTWKDAFSAIPDADEIGKMIDSKIVTYDTLQTQTNDEFRREVTKSISDNTELIDTKTRYFSETMDGLEIGLSGSPFTTLISHDKISFKNGLNTVSYIRHNQQVIENVIAKTSIQIGEHKFESYSGNLTIARWVGPFVE